MADRVELAFRRAALALIPRGANVLAAVSGGADSIALLHLLVRYSAGQPLKVGVAHLDHGLRRGSATDRRFVDTLARQNALERVTDRRPVDALRRRDESLEEAARRVRRAFLLQAARRLDAEWIVTGHTLDDQAETILMRLARGAGPAALSGMAPAGPGPFLRPLLGVERAELRAYLDRRGLDYRDDPSNRDLRFDRNRVRRLVLPILSEALNPRAPRHLVDAMERVREDATYLDDRARAAYRRRRKIGPRGTVEVPARWLAEAPLPLARRVARVMLEEAGVDPRRIAARHVEAILQLAAGGTGKRLDLPRGLKGRRRRDSVVLAR